MAKKVFKNSGVWFVVILLGVLLALWWGLGFAEKARQSRLEQQEIERILDERGEAENEAAEGETEDADGVPVDNARAAMIADVEDQAADLLPGADGASAISRFWFASDTEVYVEYTVQGEIRMVFLAEQEDALARTAYYAQSQAGTWELLEGDEVLFTKPLRDLYERDSNGNWIERN